MVMRISVLIILFMGLFSRVFSSELTDVSCYEQSDSILSISGGIAINKPVEAREKDNQKHHFNLVKNSGYILPALLVGYGFTSLHNGITRNTDFHIHHEMMEEYPHFSTNIDDELQYAPVVLAYTLSVAGVKSKNSFFDRTAMYLISNSIMSFSVDYLKTKTSKLRPSGADRRSFPSGHTATAFVSAEFMRQELGDQSPWYGYIGYSMATATGALRMMNNAHWLSDVLAGAGVGILSTKFTYLAYPWIKKKIIKNRNLNFIAVPLVQSHTYGLSFVAPL
jgi:hypothetical protein